MDANYSATATTMVEDWISSPMLTSISFIVSALGLVVAFWFTTTRASTNTSTIDKDDKNNERLPPLFPDGSSIFLSYLMGKEGPWKLFEVAQRMGTPVYRVAGFLPERFQPSLYVLFDYKSARCVLEDRSSHKWEPANEFFSNTTNGPNFITSNGHRWKHVRKSTMECFSSANIKIMKDTIQTVVDEWAGETLEARIKESPDNEVHVDILGEMNQITAAIIGQVAFDYTFTKEERNVFLVNLETCWVEYGQKMGMNPFKRIPLTRWMFPGIRRAQAASKVMYDMCDKMMQEYRSRQDVNPRPHKLIHAIVNDPEYENDEERLRDMVAYVIAGFDTTANTLSFAFRELALNPKIQADLRQDVVSVSDRSSGNKFLKHVVRELLRMYPAAAAGSVRVVERSFPVGNDGKYTIPKKAIVLTSYYGIQRDPDVYKDPNTFMPNRWENPSDAMTRCLLTFSAGPRSCQGQALANAELHEVLGNLIERYEFGIVEKGLPTNLVLFKPVGTILSVRKVVL